MFEAEYPNPGAPLPERRSVLRLVTGAILAIGGSAVAWPLLVHLDATDGPPPRQWVDLSAIAPGTRATVQWGHRKVFIHHRSAEEIAAAQSIDPRVVIPEADSDRVLDPAWLVVFGHCSYDGTQLSGQGLEDRRGIFGGWLCPHCWTPYDLSGRPGPGMAARALEIPPYSFSRPTEIEIG
jgi:ubiquinol-cytochrome c reductase iron-sulfur subunit